MDFLDPTVDFDPPGVLDLNGTAVLVIGQAVDEFIDLPSRPVASLFKNLFYRQRYDANRKHYWIGNQRDFGIHWDSLQRYDPVISGSATERKLEYGSVKSGGEG